MATLGRVHSLETMGALDGPGLRCVVFLQGCPLRCQYCHNPDMWERDGGEQWTAEDLVARVARYRPYFGQAGGVTLSGGEPLHQAEFAAAVLRGCREEGLHTALDTSGCRLDAAAREALDYTDLVLLDLKHTDPERHRALTGGELQRTLEFLEHVGARGLPLWVRQVIVPGWNDDAAAMAALAERVAPVAGLRRVELLPYHRLAMDKWERLGLPYPLSEVEEAPAARVAALGAVLRGELGRRGNEAEVR